MKQEYAQMLAAMAPLLADPGAERFKDGWLSLNPESESIYPSQNLNRIDHIGVRGIGSVEDLDAIRERFRGKKHAFFHLSPGPREEEFRAEFAKRKWKKQWAEMSLLARSLDGCGQYSGYIRPAYDAAEACSLGSRERMGRMFGRPEAHLLIWDDGLGPEGLAALYVAGDIAYLGDAATKEASRGRGIQTALITHRLRLAADMGCRVALVETYDWLPSSFANLVRAGFREVLRREIYGIPGLRNKG